MPHFPSGEKSEYSIGEAWSRSISMLCVGSSLSNRAVVLVGRGVEAGDESEDREKSVREEVSCEVSGGKSAEAQV